MLFNETAVINAGIAVIALSIREFMRDSRTWKPALDTPSKPVYRSLGCSWPSSLSIFRFCF